jgi:hypothetical protein
MDYGDPTMTTKRYSIFWYQYPGTYMAPVKNIVNHDCLDNVLLYRNRLLTTTGKVRTDRAEIIAALNANEWIITRKCID